MKLEEAYKLIDQLVFDMRRVGTLEVVLYGGPAVGKSTTRALLFAELKKRGRNTEEATEVAKDFVWEDAFGKLSYQPYMLAKQMWRLRRLHDKVEVIITDTSTLYGLVYGTEENGVTEAFSNWIIDDYNRRNTLNFYLQRNPNIAYDERGRNQALNEALTIDQDMLELLQNCEIPFTEIEVDMDGDSHIKAMADRIEQVLDLYTDSGFRRESADISEEFPEEEGHWARSSSPGADFILDSYDPDRATISQCTCDVGGYKACMSCLNDLMISVEVPEPPRFPEELKTKSPEQILDEEVDRTASQRVPTAPGLDRETMDKIVRNRGDMELWEGGSPTYEELFDAILKP